MICFMINANHASGQLIISSSHFARQRKSNLPVPLLTAEASELEHEMARLGHDRLSKRAGEHGFWMRSERTGCLAWFARVREDRDAEGDLESVWYESRVIVDNRLNLVKAPPMLVNVIND
jgi:hypothetical protein